LRAAALVLLGIAFTLVPSASSALQVGSTACAVDVRARSANLDCATAMPGGALSLGGAPTITTAVAGGEAGLFRYDAFGRLVAADVGGRLTSYGYDDAGRLSVLVDPSGETTRYAYDALGRLVAAGGASFAYSENGLTRATEADGEVVDYTYDSRGNLLSVNQGESSGRFSYDGHRRVTLVETTAVRTVYDYDGRHLVRRVQDGEVTEYTYDERGNLVRSVSGQAVDYDYDGDGSLLHISSAGAVTTFSYDRGGRLTAISGSDGGVTEFAYNEAGLVAAVTPEVGDEVLVSFEHGDVNAPLIIGYLWSEEDAPPVSISSRGRLHTCGACP
jgi:YD repeat-containing protein